MVQTKDAKAAQQADAAAGGSGASLGKGAWDADNNCSIPPEAEVRQTQQCCTSVVVDRVFGMAVHGIWR